MPLSNVMPSFRESQKAMRSCFVHGDHPHPTCGEMNDLTCLRLTGRMASPPQNALSRADGHFLGDVFLRLRFREMNDLTYNPTRSSWRHRSRDAPSWDDPQGSTRPCSHYAVFGARVNGARTEEGGEGSGQRHRRLYIEAVILSGRLTY